MKAIAKKSGDNEKASDDDDKAQSEGGEDEIYYDEMEYGDELNDQEERDYKNSLRVKPERVEIKKDLP